MGIETALFKSILEYVAAGGSFGVAVLTGLQIWYHVRLRKLEKSQHGGCSAVVKAQEAVDKVKQDLKDCTESVDQKLETIKDGVHGHEVTLATINAQYESIANMQKLILRRLKLNGGS